VADIENEQDKEAEKLFANSIVEEGARPVELEDEGVEHKSRSEEESESPDISDLKSTINKLFPTIPQEIVSKLMRFTLQTAMIARIAPDVFLDLMYLNVTDMIEDWETTKGSGSVEVQACINLVYYLLSVGIDGKGRVDIIQVSANATETKESSNFGASMGL
jgi:hypothetical protein